MEENISEEEKEKKIIIEENRSKKVKKEDSYNDLNNEETVNSTVDEENTINIISNEETIIKTFDGTKKNLILSLPNEKKSELEEKPRIISNDDNLSKKEVQPKKEKMKRKYEDNLEYKQLEEKEHTDVYFFNLPFSLTDQLLLATFSPYGNIITHRILKDWQSEISLGCGFVRYETKEEANLAIATLNGHILGKSILSVQLAYSTIEESQYSNNLFVKHLPAHWDESNIKNLFENYGTILECHIQNDVNSIIPRVIALVRYYCEEEATTAFDSLNNYTPQGATRPLIIQFAETEKQKNARIQRTPSMQTPMVHSMYGTSHMSMPNQPVYNQYPQYQQYAPEYQNYMYPQESYMNCAPFPNCATPQPNASPIYSNNNRYASYNMQPQEPDHSNLFIFHLPMSVDDTGLFALFSPFGPLESVKVGTDPNTGMSKGYGFVKFRNPQDALHAIQMMNGYKIENKYLKVSVKTKVR